MLLTISPIGAFLGVCVHHVIAMASHEFIIKKTLVQSVMCCVLVRLGLHWVDLPEAILPQKCASTDFTLHGPLLMIQMMLFWNLNKMRALHADG